MEEVNSQKNISFEKKIKIIFAIWLISGIISLVAMSSESLRNSTSPIGIFLAGIFAIGSLASLVSFVLGFIAIGKVRKKILILPFIASLEFIIGFIYFLMNW